MICANTFKTGFSFYSKVAEYKDCSSCLNWVGANVIASAYSKQLCLIVFCLLLWLDKRLGSLIASNFTFPHRITSVEESQIPNQLFAVQDSDGLSRVSYWH